MKLEKWALIAEIIGGIAIVVTLIVLVIEIRGNTTELRAATVSSVAERTQEIALLHARNPEIADVDFRLATGGELSPAEIRLLGSVSIAVLNLGEESFIAHRDGRLDDEIWQTRAALVLNSLNNEVNRNHYNDYRNGGVLIKGFTDWLDAALVERYGE